MLERIVKSHLGYGAILEWQTSRIASDILAMDPLLHVVEILSIDLASDLVTHKEGEWTVLCSHIHEHV